MLKAFFIGLFLVACSHLWGAVPSPEKMDSLKSDSLKSRSVLQGKILTLDLGVGFPNLISVEAALHVLPRLHAGASYGLYPSSFTFHPQLNSNEQAAKFADGKSYTLTPDVTSKLDAICPFVRYFPGQDNFYFQLTYALLRVQSEVTSGLQDVNGVSVNGAVIKGRVDFTQVMPTLSIGALFTTHLFFFNTSLGASVLQSISTKVALTGELPERLGGATANAAALSKLEEELAKNSDTAVAALRNQVTFIPSFYLSFGFLF